MRIFKKTNNEIYLIPKNWFSFGRSVKEEKKKERKQFPKGNINGPI